VEQTTTLNKILIVTTHGQVLAAQEWTDNKLPEIYQQNIADKLDVTTLQNLIPRHLDKPLITAAATHYAEQLKQCSSYITSTATTLTQFRRPPKTRNIRPADLTYAEAATQKTKNTNNLSPLTMAATPVTTTTQSLPMEAPFDYHAELQQITHDIETKLKAKLDAAIANLQASVDT